MNNRTHLFYLLLFFIYSSFIYSQEPIYKHFGVDEGLPSSQVYDIYQSKDGYIWFATDKGISRYNGYEFENFDINDGLPGNVVLRFYPQENGEIWAYTFHNQALFYFHENFHGFVNYKYNKVLQKELIGSSIIKSVSVNSSKKVKISGHYINRIIAISDKGIVEKKHENNNFFNANMPKYMVLSTAFKEAKFFFLTTDKEVSSNFFSIKTPQFRSSHKDAIWLTKNKKAVFRYGNFVAILSDNKEIKSIKSKHLAVALNRIDSTHFFVGYYNKGGKMFNTKGKLIREFLKDKSVTAFLIDHSGGYWLSTLNSGVYYVKKPAISVYNTQNTKTSKHVNSLVKKNSSLLIGYKDGSFAKINEDKTFKFEKAFSDSYPSLVEYDAYRDKTYIFRNNKLIINDVIYKNHAPLKLSEAAVNSFVYASNRGSFSEPIKEKYRNFFRRVQDISIFKKDTLIATPFGIYQQLKDSVVELSKKFDFLSYRSDDIDVSKNGDYFFIATHGAGVVFYGEKKFNVSVKDGLTSNIVNEIHIENDSTIYACTNKGLNRIVFNDTGFNVASINKNNGLLSNEVEDIEIIKDTLWVGTKDGLCYMPKNIFDTKKLENLFLKIENIEVNDVIYDNKKSYKLNYDENKITFFVEGISFANNNDLQYKYRLKEIDTKWSSTKNRKISFPNLKEGTYTFQVKACIGIECQSEKVLEHNFVINPPFWRAWWFRTICMLVFSGLFYVFFRIRVLTYNKDVIREFMRLLIKRLKRDEKYLEIRMNGESIKVITKDILFVKSSGNYLDITTTSKTYTIRCKIGDFIATTPDALEYLRVHRSYIIRIDKVTGKSKKCVTIKDHTIPVGETYVIQLNNIHF